MLADLWTGQVESLPVIKDRTPSLLLLQAENFSSKTARHPLTDCIFFLFFHKTFLLPHPLTSRLFF